MLAEVTLYAGRDGRWLASLRPEPGSPVCWWSGWSPYLAAVLVAAKDEYRRRFPEGTREGISVYCWDNRAFELARRDRGKRRRPHA